MTGTDTVIIGGGLADDLDDDDKAMMEGSAEEEVSTEEAPAAEEKVAEAPATTEAAAEEVDEDETPVEIGEGINKGRFIRHGAFHRERKLRQAAEKARDEYNANLARMNEERARIDERLRILLQAQQQQTQSQYEQGEPQVPNPEEDPFAYMQYLHQQIQNLSQHQEQVGGRLQQQDEYTGVKTAFMQDAGRYQQAQPDFMNAYEYLMVARDRELQRLGRVDPQERARIVQQEELMIVTECLRNGRSPAELVYELAKDRGYRKAEPAAPVAPAAAPSAQAPSAAATVANIKKAQEASKSLSAASGTGTPALTAETLASMSEADFEKVVGKMSRQERAQYFGG